MRMEEAFYNISMYLYYKNFLKYAQITRSGPKSRILHIESHSTKYVTFERISHRSEIQRAIPKLL